ncbi:MAG: hypothetical protein QOK47_224 [Actinomycetota bacterium]|nr:hypothetical protein [Actinomycetota bacterium]
METNTETNKETNTTDLRSDLSTFVQICRMERRLLREILECDRNDGWQGHGARSHAEFLAGRYGISQWKARRWIGTAYALEHLPLTSHALETGRLGLDKVVELTRFATPATERKLISWARRVTPGGVRSRADIEVRLSAARAGEQDRERYLDLAWRMDGRLSIEGVLPAAEGAKVAAAIDRLADQLPGIPGEDPRFPDEVQGMPQRRADAFVLLCSAHIANDQDPDRASVVVHAPYESLDGQSKNALIEGGRVVSPEVAQRLLCNGHIELAFHGDEGIVGTGAPRHQPSRKLRRLVLHRDSHTCTFPGCEMKRFLITHHMVPWPRGATELDNLVTVCFLHHKLVHEHHWRVTLDDSQRPVWFRADGHRYDPGPAPPEDEPVPPPSSSSNVPWPAMFHALESDEFLVASEPATKWLLKYGARRMARSRASREAATAL